MRTRKCKLTLRSSNAYKHVFFQDDHIKELGKRKLHVYHFGRPKKLTLIKNEMMSLYLRMDEQIMTYVYHLKIKYFRLFGISYTIYTSRGTIKYTNWEEIERKNNLEQIKVYLFVKPSLSTNYFIKSALA